MRRAARAAPRDSYAGSMSQAERTPGPPPRPDDPRPVLAVDVDGGTVERPPATEHSTPVSTQPVGVSSVTL